MYNDPLAPYLTGQGLGDLGWNPVAAIKAAGSGIARRAKALWEWASKGGLQKTGERITEVGYAMTPAGRESLRTGYEMGKFGEALTKYWPVWLGLVMLTGLAVWGMSRKGK
ncbi:MAG: hypothetical protein ABIM19_07915 [candidate division WOR-3 bacterium]